MRKSVLSLLLALALLIALCACGGSQPAASGSAASAPDEAAASASAAEPETEQTEAAPEPESAEESSAAEPAGAEEPEEDYGTVEYPIEGGAHFDMVACLRNVTAQVFGDGGYEQTPVYKAWSEATGVTVDFQMLAEVSYNEKQNLMMASGDLPDIFHSSVSQYDANLMGAIEDEILADITPYFEEYAPDYLRFLDRYDDVKAAAYNGDGSTSVFISSTYPYRSNGLSIRQDWLDKIGMEAPTTFDELTEVLTAFKNQCGATMPLLVTCECECGLARYFQCSFAGFRDVRYQMTEPNSDTVVPIFASEGFINYLTYLHELYEKGLITNDFLNTGRNYGNFESSYLSGKSGVWEDGSAVYADANLANGEGDYNPVPFTLSGEETIHVSDISSLNILGGRAYISSICNDIPACVQFFNYCYTEEGKLLCNFGVEGESWEYDENGEIVYTDLMTNHPQGWSSMLTRAFYTGMWLPGEGVYRTVELSNTDRALDAIDLWTSTAGDKSMNLPNTVILTQDENSEFNAYAGDVLTAITEKASSVVVGDISIDDFRDLLKQLGTGGLDRMTEIYQGAYDRAMSEA